MKFKCSILLSLILLSFVGGVNGQDGNNTSYFLSNFPQRYRINPAYQPEYKVFIGLPGLSGISVNYLNSSFAVEDLLVKRQDSVYVDIDKFYKGLKKRNFINFNNENSIFSLGIKAKKWYATLDITQRNDFMLRFNKDLLTFLKEGNASHPNMDFGRLGLNGSAYLEFALGLSKEVNSKLTVGGRAKFLMGVANVHMTDSDMGVRTLDDGTLLLRSRQNIRVSSPAEVKYRLDDKGFVEWDSFDLNTDGLGVSSFLNAHNPGFAVDLGGQYKLNEKINLFASLTDLGFIHWGNKSNTYNFHQDTEFEWEGVDISNSINQNKDGYEDLDDAFDRLIDKMDTTFRLSPGGGSYNTMLSPKLHLGATYQLNKTFNVGGLFKATLVDKMFIPALTASVNARLIRNISASVSYTVTRGNYANIGAGITAKLGPFQLYAMTDNTLAANYTNTKSVSARVGINLLFGHKDHKKKSKEGAPVEVLVEPVLPRKDTLPKDTLKRDTLPADTTFAPLKEEKVTSDEPQIKACYVIVGSFKSKEKAEALRKRLVFMGFRNSTILRNEQGMYRVSAASFDTHEECWNEVRRIRKQYPQYADAWGLTVRE